MCKFITRVYPEKNVRVKHWRPQQKFCCKCFLLPTGVFKKMHDSFLKIFWALNFFVCEVECLYLSDTLCIIGSPFERFLRRTINLKPGQDWELLVFGTNNDCHYMAPYFTKKGDKNLLMFHKAIFVLHCMVHFLNAPIFVHVDTWCGDWSALNNQKVLNQSKKFEHSWGQHFYCFQKLTLSTRFFWHFAAFFLKQFSMSLRFFWAFHHSATFFTQRGFNDFK